MARRDLAAIERGLERVLCLPLSSLTAVFVREQVAAAGGCDAPERFRSAFLAESLIRVDRLVFTTLLKFAKFLRNSYDLPYDPIGNVRFVGMLETALADSSSGVLCGDDDIRYRNYGKAENTLGGHTAADVLLNANTNRYGDKRSTDYNNNHNVDADSNTIDNANDCENTDHDDNADDGENADDGDNADECDNTDDGDNADDGDNVDNKVLSGRRRGVDFSLVTSSVASQAVTQLRVDTLRAMRWICLLNACTIFSHRRWLSNLGESTGLLPELDELLFRLNMLAQQLELYDNHEQKVLHAITKCSSVLRREHLSCVIRDHDQDTMQRKKKKKNKKPAYRLAHLLVRPDCSKRLVLSYTRRSLRLAETQDYLLYLYTRLMKPFARALRLNALMHLYMLDLRTRIP